MWQRIKRWLTIAVLLPVISLIVCIIALRWINPPATSFIVKHNLVAAFSKHEVRYAKARWTDFSEISAQMSVAVLAAEDQRFPKHFGIDFAELRKSLSSESAQRRGASTLSQQVAKNLFLWSGRSYIRKIFEAGIALTLEALLSKQRILEIYLNIAQSGENIFGVTEASWQYFNKPPSDLNRYEAARIAAVLPSPSKYSVTHPSDHVLERQRWIMQQMKQLGGVKLLDQIK